MSAQLGHGSKCIVCHAEAAEGGLAGAKIGRVVAPFERHLAPLQVAKMRRARPVRREAHRRGHRGGKQAIEDVEAALTASDRDGTRSLEQKGLEAGPTDGDAGVLAALYLSTYLCVQRARAVSQGKLPGTTWPAPDPRYLWNLEST